MPSLHPKLLFPKRWRKRVAHALGWVTSPRFYLPRDQTVESIFQRIADASIKNTVLRWFETLPHVEDGEDIDILVADEDLPRLVRMLTPIEGGTPFDIYTVSGLPGTRFKGTPYFPKLLAEQVLSTTVLHKELYPVPALQEHFDSMAYHGVYHKGLASGIPSRSGARARLPVPEHDYVFVLAALRDALKLDLAIELEALDEYLGERNYRPSPEVLAILGKNNGWIRERHLHSFDMQVLAG